MNAKILTVVVGLLMLVPAGYAANAKFGDCPSGYECDTRAPQGDPFPPDAVTGHTVYAKFIMNVTVDNYDSLGLPTDFAAVAGLFEVNDRRRIVEAVQRECVVWFNGKNLDNRPAGDNFGWGSENAFPSDEDEPLPDDEAYQDYDFDRDVDTCVPRIEGGGGGPDNESANYAVVVEKGDCNPAGGVDFRFRGHLDFVDPNNIYHEVQEYDYVCNGLLSFGGPGGNWIPGTNGDGFFGNGTNSAVSDAVKDLFPWTYTDRHNQNGCRVYHDPSDAVDPGADTGDVDPNDPGNATPPSADPSADPDAAYFDLGHKCNGSVQDLFTERLWITPFHYRTFDPTIQQYYNFALQIDTCSGLNIYERSGKDAMGESNNYTGSESDPGSIYALGRQIGPEHNIDSIDYFLDNNDLGQPLVEVCHDGSSFSFDDTPRGRTTHSGPPADEEEIMRGNSYDFDANSNTFGKHRQNCRSNYIDWPYNDYPGRNKAQEGPLSLFGAPGPRESIGEDCYPEDHKTAHIDIYVYDEDPTGLFLANSNGLTGLNAYVEGESTGPDYLPPAA